MRQKSMQNYPVGKKFVSHLLKKELAVVGCKNGLCSSLPMHILANIYLLSNVSIETNSVDTYQTAPIGAV